MQRGAVAIAAVLAAVLVLAGCTAPAPSDDPEILHPGGPDGSTATATPTSEPVSAADVEFVQSMIAHHAQAVTLAGLADGRAADPELASFAERIAQAQQAELDNMVQWLTQRNLPVGEHDHDASTMPGGISATTMARAEAATGADFDALFIPAMIGHHQGALEMAQTRLDAGGSSSITRLAQSIISGQQLEIERLAEIGARLGLSG
jgi:uncharacterized protein (DUF305 family)